jgi:uncharacterized protein YutE (UPF0331/DUF86 family)
MRRLDVPELLTRLREILDLLGADLAALQSDALPSVRETAALERWLQLAIQISLDLGDRLLAALVVEEPPRYRDIFSALERQNVLAAPLARTMERLTDLRNALVHEYGEFGPATTPAHVRTALPTLREYAVAISAAFDRQDGTP